MPPSSAPPLLMVVPLTVPVPVNAPPLFTVMPFDEAIEPLGRAAVLKPIIVLDGAPDGIFANSRRNLDTYISEARQKMYSIREELER